MREVQSANVWDFTRHPEWQELLDDNGIQATCEYQAPSTPHVLVDTAKLSADALRFNEFVIGSHTFDKSA